MTTLIQLALEAGLQPEWIDATGTPQLVSEETLRSVLDALGLPAGTPDQIAGSHVQLTELRRRGAEACVTGKVGRPVALPETISGPAELNLENGETRRVDLTGHRLEALEEPGYHRLLHDQGETLVATAPERCFSPSDAGCGAHIWGAAAQLPSLRGAAAAPFGDFAALREAAPALARQGASLLAISPVHALFPSDAGRYSPYGPSSRRCLNVLFADPALAGIETPAEEDTGHDGLIDWEHAIPRRMSALREAFDRLDGETRARFSSVAHLSGAQLRNHAIFDVLYAHYSEQGLWGWQNWPLEYRDPNGKTVDLFAESHSKDIAFYTWLQGLTAQSLAAAQEAARDGGMGIGILTDLAVGIDPGGSDSWSKPDAFLHCLSVGAPPDPLGPEGQDWGLTTFNPLALPFDHYSAFRETLSAAMANAGGLRIDHVLGLRRIWVVPHGRPSSEGCYLAFPQADMFNILALESWRNRAIVIGEDLGTVPEGLRSEMAEANISGMRVLWFERDEDGSYIDPADWDRKAAAMTSTHDLPTLAGWWCGRDIDWTWRIGRKSGFDTEEAERADRTRERSRLWQTLVQRGHADGPQPPPDEPTSFVTAACKHVADSGCEIALFPLEDLFGAVEQPNLPGTTDQHPNWRRRLPDSVSALVRRPEIAQRLDLIEKARSA